MINYASKTDKLCMLFVTMGLQVKFLDELFSLKVDLKVSFVNE